MHHIDQMLIEGQAFWVKGGSFRIAVMGEWVISLRRQAMLPVQLFSQMLFAILDGLCNVFGRAKAPSQNIVSKAGLSKLSAQINVGVPYQDRL